MIAAWPLVKLSKLCCCYSSSPRILRGFPLYYDYLLRRTICEMKFDSFIKSHIDQARPKQLCLPFLGHESDLSSDAAFRWVRFSPTSTYDSSEPLQEWLRVSHGGNDSCYEVGMPSEKETNSRRETEVCEIGPTAQYL